MSSFTIPTPYRAWCHVCPQGQGFMTLEELTNHSRQVHGTGINGLRNVPPLPKLEKAK